MFNDRVRTTGPECNGVNDCRSLKSTLSSSNEVHSEMKKKKKKEKDFPSHEYMYESDALRVIFKFAEPAPYDRDC